MPCLPIHGTWSHSRLTLCFLHNLSQGAWVEIPELEFEIGQDHKRRVDSVYNHISASIFNLERHVEMIGDALERKGISDACDDLRRVLDLDQVSIPHPPHSASLIAQYGTDTFGFHLSQPVTFIVTDPGGLSAFKPNEGVKVLSLEDTTGQYDRSARAVAVPEHEREMDKVD